MTQQSDILVIGAGLAGLVSAIHLSRAGFSVTLVEKQELPRHKVCGEYISNEVLPYLKSLKIPLEPLNPVRINRFRLSAPSGKTVETTLGMGAFSVRRYTFDEYLASLAKKCGVQFHTRTTIEQVDWDGTEMIARTPLGESFQSRLVIGAYGKRSVLDRTLDRPFFQKKVDYVGIKTYFKVPDFPEDLVELHNFPGGYCGLSKVENGWVNAAYLTSASSLKKMNGVQQLQEQVLSTNPHLKSMFRQPQMLPKPLVISNVSFVPKRLITNHVLMAGDAAGMIPPLAGNGMAMAIHSAKILSETAIPFLQGDLSRTQMEARYEQKWNRQFRRRLFWGRQLQKYMGSRSMELGVGTLTLFPGILSLIVRQTHGTYLSV